MIARPYQLPYRAAVASPLNSPWPPAAAVEAGGVAWDAATKGASYTLSDGDLTASRLSNAYPTQAVVSTVSKSSGKWYFEFKWDSGYGAGINNNCAVGVCSESFDPTADDVGDGDGSSTFAVYDVDGSSAPENAQFGLPDDTWGWCAFDVDAQKLWVGTVGGDAMCGDPAAGTDPARGTGSAYGDDDLGGGAVRVIFAAYGNDPTPSTCTVNFGATAFQGTPPTGFTALGG